MKILTTHIRKRKLIMNVVMAAAAVCSLSAAQPVYACSLPDGSTNGVYMSDQRTCCPSGTENDGTQCLYAKYINPLIALLAAAVGTVVVIAIVYGAVEYISSGGDPKRVESGKRHITNALIGLVAFILLYAFLQFIIPGGLISGH